MKIGFPARAIEIGTPSLLEASFGPPLGQLQPIEFLYGRPPGGTLKGSATRSMLSTTLELSTPSAGRGMRMAPAGAKSVQGFLAKLNGCACIVQYLAQSFISLAR